MIDDQENIRRINANLPVAEIEDGRLKFTMEDKIMKKRIQSVKGEAVLNRLRIVLKESGMSGRKFAEKIGLKAESATRLFNGVTGLTKPLAYSIELHFGFRSQWLLTGEGLKITEYDKQGNMENPLDRLSWVRKKVGLNSKAFAESIGLTASSLHNMYTRGSKVSNVLANSVELIHGIRAKWLLTGEGITKET